jgi:hypothetical protein
MGTTCTKSGLAPKQLAPKHPGQARRAATASVTATKFKRVTVAVTAMEGEGWQKCGLNRIEECEHASR